MGVVAGAGWPRRWEMRRARARTGHKDGSLVMEWPMVSPRVQFFWSVKVKDTKVAWLTSFKEALAAGMDRLPSWAKVTSQMRKGEERASEARLLVQTYSPARSRKKNPMMMRSRVA